MNDMTTDAPFTQGTYTFHFVGYVVHHHTANCRCGSVNHWTTLYRVFAATNAKDIAKRLIPCNDLPEGTPVVAFEMPPISVPLCAYCLKTRPDELVVLATDDRAWNQAIREVIAQKQQSLGEAARERAKEKRVAARDANLPQVDLAKAAF